jgi:ArsR family transcriptional regulator
MENAQIEDVARLLKSIAHPIRLKILCLLQDGELSVGDLLAVVGTTNGNLSQHLAILRHQGIIVSHKDANYIYNRIADPRILSLMRGMQSLFCSRGGQQGVPVEPDLAGFGLIEPPECHSDPGD